MTNPFSGTAAGSSFSNGGGATTHPSSPHGLGGLIENFAHDVKDSVIGLPAGVVHLAEHPVGGVEQVAKSTWQTWGPLFHGQFGKFATGVYEHPLAPLLDVSAVFDGGLSLAGKVGRVAEVGDTSLLGKAARLTEPKRIELTDPLAKEGGVARMAVGRDLSQRPLRRMMQEHVIPRAIGTLPASTQDNLAKFAYESRLHAHMAYRSAAKAATLATVMKAGKALSDSANAPIIRGQLAARLWRNLYNHAPVDMPHAEAVDYLMQHTHELPVKDPAFMAHGHAQQIQVMRRQEAKLAGIVQKHSARAAALPNLVAERDRQNALLTEMHAKGYQIAAPAVTKLKEPTTRQLIERNAAPVVEVQNNVKMLNKQIAKAERSHAIYTENVPKLQDAMATRMANEKRRFGMHFEHVGSTEETFNNYAQNFGRNAVVSIRGSRTRSKVEAALSRAYHDPQGNVRIAPKHDATMLGKEMGNSSTFAKWMYKKPTQVWKMAQVGYSPRTVVNNSVGNMTIYMLREHPVSGAYGLFQAMKALHGTDKASEDFAKAALSSKQGWLRHNFAPDLNNVFGNDMLGGSGIRNKLKAGFYPLVHKIADEPVRGAAIASYLRRSPEVQALMKTGKSFDQAVTEELRHNKPLAARASAHAMSIAGDYQTLRPWEQHLRNVMPFYMWDRHIVRSTKNLVADNPARAVALSQVSQMGKGETEKVLGKVPEFLQGALPLSMLGLGHNAGDRASVVLTNSLNPFATVGDLADMGQAITAGHTVQPGALFSGTNPLLTGAAEFATGKSLLTGAPKPAHAGLLTSIGANLGQGLPGYKLVQGMLTPPTLLTAKGKTKMYAVDRRSPISSFLGVPTRNVSKSAVNAAALKEQGVKKAPKRKNPFS